MAHPYGQSADVQRLLRTSQNRVKFGASITGNDMTTTDLASFIEEWDDYLDNELKKWYVVPMTGADIVKIISTRFTAYDVWIALFAAAATAENIPPPVQFWHDTALKILDGIKDQAAKGIYLSGETLATPDLSAQRVMSASHIETVYNEDVQFTKFDWAAFDHNHVIEGSEQVYTRIASTDTSDGYDVGTALTRDTDYEVDYALGWLRRKSGGAITDGQTVRIKKYTFITDFASEFNLLLPDRAGDYGNAGKSRSYY